MAILPLFCTAMETKDRIKQIMEDQKMTQQVFADFLQQSPATLSSIFNGRTRPTLNIVDAIKAKIPDISIECYSMVLVTCMSPTLTFLPTYYPILHRMVRT